MADLGFKALTKENWLEPDGTLDYFVHVTSEGRKVSIGCDEWARRVFAPVLVGNVPTEVKRLFEVARGAMIYGYYFYPLFTLAAEQVFRVAESAVSHKCGGMGAPTSVRWFAEKIDWLVEQKVITPDDGKQWHTIRWLRNEASHPRMQTIVMPADAIGALVDVARRINLLFDG